MVIVLSLLVSRREHPGLCLLVALLMGIPISEMSQCDTEDTGAPFICGGNAKSYGEVKTEEASS